MKGPFDLSRVIERDYEGAAAPTPVTFPTLTSVSINGYRFSHRSHHGTEFVAERCDLQGGVKVSNVPGDPARFASDVAEMVGYHACNIRPSLNGFAGYDCVGWVIEEVEDGQQG